MTLKGLFTIQNNLKYWHKIIAPWDEVFNIILIVFTDDWSMIIFSWKKMTWKEFFWFLAR